MPPPVGTPCAVPDSVSQQSEALKQRTSEFARRIIGLCEKVPTTQVGRTLTRQLVDAATAAEGAERAEKFTRRDRREAEVAENT